jgi:hypothetical protein
MDTLREELNGFDLVELWFYAIGRKQNNQGDFVWIAEGGEA